METVVRASCLLVCAASLAAAQEVVPLDPGAAPGSTGETYPEKTYFSKVWTLGPDSRGGAEWLELQGWLRK